VDLGSFYRGDLEGSPHSALPELLRAILIRTNFTPLVRHALGWRGLRQSSAEPEGWTARIQRAEGVFGLCFDGLAPAPGWVRGRFSLHYFPDPKEALVERCALEAAALTQQPDYWRRIGGYPGDPDFTRLFTIGCLALSVDSAGRSLGLCLESLSAQQSISEAGVCLPRDGRMVSVIAPGGVDQDFPAFAMASLFFGVLAASLTFNLGQAPAFLAERRFSATRLIMEKAGRTRETEAKDLWRGTLLLGYGEDRFGDLEKYENRPGPVAFHSLTWHRGEPLPESYGDRLWWQAERITPSATIDKTLLGIDERPPLIVLTGFLGSGKTSFLQHFIEYQTQRSRFVAVIQNEIGEIGLDGQLLDYAVTEIDEGCVCCSLAGNLKRAVHGIMERFSPDCIILETSGLANPLNLLEELGELADLVRFDITVTVVDALNVESSLADCAIVADQIAAADLLLLNKVDLVDNTRLRTVRQRLAALNARAPIVAVRHGDANPALLFDLPDGMKASNPVNSPPRSISGRILHADHARDGFSARSILLPTPISRTRFLQAIGDLPPSIFRAKGIVDLSDPPQTALFQFVAGRHTLTPHPAPRDAQRFVTFIGRLDDPDSLRWVEFLFGSPEGRPFEEVERRAG